MTFIGQIIYALFKPFLEELFKQFNLAGSRPVVATDAAPADPGFKAAWDGSLAGQLERMRLVREKQGGVR
jgi:hypothetical protein